MDLISPLKSTCGVIGISHNTASIELRDQAYLSVQENEQNSKRWLQKCDFSDLVVVSTCNRTEIYFYGDTSKVKILSEQWRLYKEIDAELFYEHLYFHQANDAILHLFRVSSSLDSMILGENQILGQIKDSYELAQKLNTTQINFHLLFQKATSIGKKIRTETALSKGAFSIASAAVKLMQKIDVQLFNKKIAIVGVGEMAKIVCAHLQRLNCPSFDVYNRTFSKAELFSQSFSGKAFPLEQLSENIDYYDIVICATSSPDFILTHQELKCKISTCKKNLLFMDISVPRDIDPLCSQFSSVFVFSVDDLKQVIQESKEERKKEALKADKYIKEEVFIVEKEMKLLGVGSIIKNWKNEIDDCVFQKLSFLKENEVTRNSADLEKRLYTLSKKWKHEGIEKIKNAYLKSDDELQKVISSEKKQLLGKLKEFII